MHRVHADIPSRAQKFHSLYFKHLATHPSTDVGVNSTFKTCFFPAASNAAASELYTVILTKTHNFAGRKAHKEVKQTRDEKECLLRKRKNLITWAQVIGYLNASASLCS